MVEIFAMLASVFRALVVRGRTHANDLTTDEYHDLKL
jgi:hypothetical protein